MNSQKDEIEIDLREIFLIIRRNLLVIVAFTVLGAQVYLYRQDLYSDEFRFRDQPERPADGQQPGK